MSHLEQVCLGGGHLHSSSAQLLYDYDDKGMCLFTFLVHLGRHRCIGENFAFIQIKTIWSILLRKYEFDLVDGHFPPVNYTTMIHTPTQPIIRYRRRY